MIEYDHLLKVKKVDEDMKFEDALNTQSKFDTLAYADPLIQTLSVGTFIQFERRGFYILDQFVDNVPHMIYIPDGKAKTMSGLSAKVDVGKFSGNLDKNNTEVKVEKKSNK